ncbi:MULTISPECIES: aminotransferase class V-fold PLP-dependent enzyme [unclassified Cyanobium]|uniref:aminotransferase class V-fold PLP-dependent enzyme n=1 Tax=unclassified Cyanobium TaxID=2627006 RepID=UPI0020CC89B8|nr:MULTISPECIES: aminotransferase class V-fold PLP-dependent enzyme [unclassified Cyanobium]MCP9833760.1 aminotransferase class V-fold PLP-dependent enzyme [Cyanobium sp. La Preciosa 7G6]MCP9936482.1 aminotransferase class V-fold PLP-dependent enzyme [Cyanobium sp. Aljojuca 7A6]
MPALANKTYFNYGGQGPLPSPSLAAISEAFTTIQELGPFSDDVWPYVNRTISGLRQRLATWFGVDAERVAFTENVTSGCVLPLWGLPWQAGDELLVSDAEHYGVVAALEELARRHQLRITSLAVADLTGGAGDTAAAVGRRLEAALSPRTRLVVLSHLLWNTGQTMPIAAVAAQLAGHPRHPWLLVDAAQSLGSLPVAAAASAADIYACTGHKWCCGPEGLGAVALSERLLAESSPTLIGWRSLEHDGPGAGGYHRDARRFEVATSCTPLLAGLDQSLQLLEAEGEAETRLAAIRERSVQLWEGLQRLAGVRTLLKVPPPAGLVSFTLAGPTGEPLDPGAIVKRLGDRGIWLRTLESPACMRACTHLVSTADEVERLLAQLAQLSVG